MRPLISCGATASRKSGKSKKNPPPRGEHLLLFFFKIHTISLGHSRPSNFFKLLSRLTFPSSAPVRDSSGDLSLFGDFFVFLVFGDCYAMDVTALRDRIQSTLDANADIRRQAELDLKYVCAGCWINWRGHRWAHTWVLYLGRDATRFYQWTFGYFAGRAEQRSSAFW